MSDESRSIQNAEAIYTTALAPVYRAVNFKQALSLFQRAYIAADNRNAALCLPRTYLKGRRHLDRLYNRENATGIALGKNGELLKDELQPTSKFILHAGVMITQQEKIWIQENFAPDKEFYFFIFESIAAWFADAHGAVEGDDGTLAAERRKTALGIAQLTWKTFHEERGQGLHRLNPVAYLRAVRRAIAANKEAHREYNFNHPDDGLALTYNRLIRKSA